jgi:hypothetical protein
MLLGYFARFARFLPPRPRRPSLIALFLLTPLLAVSLMLAFCGRTLLDCGPFFSDEVYYWNEVAAFARAGFDGGYFAPNEQTAPWPLFHFGPHGPGYPIVYGSIAKVFGWYRLSAPFYNVVLMMLSAGFWVWCCRPDDRRLATGAFLMATFCPCLLYIPSTMQECLHFSIAFLLAGLAHSAINEQLPAKWSIPAFIAAVTVASLIRLTWVVVLIPWAAVFLSRESWRTRVIIVAVITALGPSILYVTRMIDAPYPTFVATLIADAKTNPYYAYAEFAQYFSHGMYLFLAASWGETIEVAQRYEVTALVLAILVAILLRKAVNLQSHAFAAFNLVIISLLTIGFYEIRWFRDYRVIAPHLLLSLLVLLSGGAYRWVLYIACIQLTFLVPFYNYFSTSNQDRFAIQGAAIAKDREIIEKYVKYTPAECAWDNTILIAEGSYIYTLVAIPPGIGVSWILTQRDANPRPIPPRSRYLLMGGGHSDAVPPEKVHLRHLVHTDSGELYLNLDRFHASESAANCRE